MVQEGVELVPVDIANGGKTADDTEEQETGQKGALESGGVLEVRVGVVGGVPVSLGVIGAKQAL